MALREIPRGLCSRSFRGMQSRHGLERMEREIEGVQALSVGKTPVKDEHSSWGEGDASLFWKWSGVAGLGPSSITAYMVSPERGCAPCAKKDVPCKLCS